MTDFIGLQLGLDTSQFTSGARSAQQALAGIEQSTIRASGATIQYTGSMNSLFTRRGAIGSLGQVAQGIDSVTRAATSGSPAMAALSASFLALEIGKTVGDFKEMAAATKVVGAAASESAIGMGIYGSATAAATTANVAAVSGFSRVFAVLRANPLLALAGVAGAVGAAITIVSSVMTLFGSSTAKATKEVKEQVSALDQLKSRITDLDYRKSVSGNDPRTSLGGTLDVLSALNAGKKDATLSVKEAAKLFGVSETDLRSRIDGVTGRVGFNVPGSASEISPFNARRYDSFSSADFPAMSRGEKTPGSVDYFDPSKPVEFARQDFPISEILKAGESLYKKRQKEDIAAKDSGAYPSGLVSGLSRPTPLLSDGEINQRDFDNVMKLAEERARQQEESLRTMVELSGQVGANLGQGAADMLFKLRSAQDVLKSLLQSMVASGLQSAGQALFSGLAKGIGNAFSTTPEQSSGGGGGLVIDGQNVK